MAYYLGIDLGGTNIAVGVVDEHYQIIGRGRIKHAFPVLQKRCANSLR
ncbi:hypothetical protein [Anaeromassilibacillus sp. SJQ-1]